MAKELVRVKRTALKFILINFILLFIKNPVIVSAQDSAILPHILFLSSYSYDWESVPNQIDEI